MMERQNYITVLRENEVRGVVLRDGKPYMYVGARGQQLPDVGPRDGPKVPCFTHVRKLVPVKEIVRRPDGSYMPVPECCVAPVLDGTFMDSSGIVLLPAEMKG